METEDINSYIINQEAAYQARSVTVIDGYEWSMYRHIRLSTLYKNGQLDSGNDDGMKPVKNIIKPILNVAYRSEGFDVKDINLYVNDEKNYYKSFLTKKYNSKWARQYNFDTFIDKMVESYVDYGGALIKFLNKHCPEVVPLQRIAFCDQTDLLAGVICEKHPYTPDELMEKTAWDKDAIEEAITLAVAEKTNSPLNAKKSETPQKYIDVYELHGVMPTRWLSKEEGDEYDVEGYQYTRQAQYIAFPTKQSRDDKQGILLWKGPEQKDRYKLLLRDEVYGRALGYGGVEELFEDQAWTTYSLIKIREMLDAAALMIVTTTDAAFAERNKVTDLDTAEIHVLADGKTISQLNLQPLNMAQFDNWVAQWDAHSKTMGSATDGSLAIKPASGTPFALEALNTQNGLQMHEYRQGKVATFTGELYRDWLLPMMARDMANGDKWVDDLSLEEMQWVAEQIANNAVIEKALTAFRTKGARIPTVEEGEQMKTLIKDEFKRGGSKKFLEIFKGEMKTLPMDVEVNIVGKQKDLFKVTQALTNIFRQVFANPQVLANPAMAKLFNQIVEASGFSPGDFSGLTAVAEPTKTVTPELTPTDTAVPAAVVA